MDLTNKALTAFITMCNKNLYTFNFCKEINFITANAHLTITDTNFNLTHFIWAKKEKCLNVYNWYKIQVITSFNGCEIARCQFTKTSVLTSPQYIMKTSNKTWFKTWIKQGSKLLPFIYKHICILYVLLYIFIYIYIYAHGYANFLKLCFQFILKAKKYFKNSLCSIFIITKENNE